MNNEFLFDIAKLLKKYHYSDFAELTAFIRSQENLDKVISLLKTAEKLTKELRKKKSNPSLKTAQKDSQFSEVANAIMKDKKGAKKQDNTGKP
jgi:hypothetical protein